MHHQKPCNEKSCPVCSTLGSGFIFFDDTNSTCLLEISRNELTIRTPETDTLLNNHKEQPLNRFEASRKAIRVKKSKKKKSCPPKKVIEEAIADVSYEYFIEGIFKRTIGTQTEICVFKVFDDQLRAKCIAATGGYTTVEPNGKYITIYGDDGPSMKSLFRQAYYLFIENAFIITNKLFDVTEDSDPESEDEDNQEEYSLESGYVAVSMRARDGSTRNFMYLDPCPQTLRWDSDDESEHEFYTEAELEDSKFMMRNSRLVWY